MNRWLLVGVLVGVTALLSAENNWSYWERRYKSEEWQADSIAYVLDKAEDDEIVHLEGRLMDARTADREDRILTDGVNEILVEMPDEAAFALPKKRKIGANGAPQKFRIIGEVDIERSGEVKVDVEWFVAVADKAAVPEARPPRP